MLNNVFKVFFLYYLVISRIKEFLLYMHFMQQFHLKYYHASVAFVIRFFNRLAHHYTGWLNKNGTVDFQDFALINSYFFQLAG